MPELWDSHQATAHKEVLIEDADQYAMVVGSVDISGAVVPRIRHGEVAVVSLSKETQRRK